MGGWRKEGGIQCSRCGPRLVVEQQLTSGLSTHTVEEGRSHGGIDSQWPSPRGFPCAVKLYCGSFSSTDTRLMFRSPGLVLIAINHPNLTKLRHSDRHAGNGDIRRCLPTRIGARLQGFQSSSSLLQAHTPYACRENKGTVRQLLLARGLQRWPLSWRRAISLHSPLAALSPVARLVRRDTNRNGC